MNNPTPVVSRAAPALPALPDPIMADGEDLEEPIVQGDYYSAEQMRAYALAALASRETSLSTLADERAAFAAWYISRHGADYSPHKNETWDNASRADDEEVWLARAALASPRATPKE